MFTKSMLRGLRFQKKIRLGDFIHLNLSKSGISGTVGIPGLRLNFATKGVTLTLGFPGTGLSWRGLIAKWPATAETETASPTANDNTVVVNGLEVAEVIADTHITPEPTPEPEAPTPPPAPAKKSCGNCTGCKCPNPNSSGKKPDPLTP